MRWLVALTGVAIAVLLMPSTAAARRGLESVDGHLLATAVPMFFEKADAGELQERQCGPTVEGRETPRCRLQPPLNKLYENRTYLDARWVTVKLQGGFNDAAYQGVIEGISYFNGKNVDGTTISLASPIRINGTLPGELPGIAHTTLFVPSSFTGRLPKPQDSNIFSETCKYEQFYVLKLDSDLPTVDMFRLGKFTLTYLLNLDDVKYREDTFQLVSYGPPFSAQPLE
ncbi:hypothetical protein CBR_g64075, partial [Chara braunii]